MRLTCSAVKIVSTLSKATSAEFEQSSIFGRFSAESSGAKLASLMKLEAGSSSLQNRA